MSPEAWIIGLHLFTVHAGPLTDPGAHRALPTPGIYAVAPSGLTFGGYRNSLSGTPLYPGERYSAYAGWTWRTGAAIGPASDITITAGAVTGYVRQISPLVGVGARLGTGELATRVLWVPHRTQPLSLSLERRF